MEVLNLNSLTTEPTAGRLLAQRLAKYDYQQEELTAFAAYIDGASDLELYRINPRRVAAKAQLDLRRAIELSALSVREGVFDMFWGVCCPGCTGELLLLDSLQDATEGEVTCVGCQITVPTNSGHELRALFSLNPAIRVLDIPNLDIVSEDGTEPETEEDFFKSLTPGQIAFFEDLTLHTKEFDPITSLDLMHIQLFRDFFREEVIPVHISLKITRVALVFTDLRGSTALYAAKGDPQAYSLVRSHFEILTRETNRYGGVVIKTIGDAVMASFQRDIDAVRAAIAFQKAFEDFNEIHNLQGDNRLTLKVGVHSGPCLSVNQNNVLDYFGTTVNMAARIGALSKGSDIMISKSTLADPMVQAAVLSEGFVPAQELKATLRGLPDEVEVCQLVAAIPSEELTADRIEKPLLV